jgi:hypothetical protein
LGGFEILRAMTKRNSVFLDVTQCNPVKLDQRFRGEYRLHLQLLRVSHEAVPKKEASSNTPNPLLVAGFLLGLSFGPEYEDDIFVSNVSYLLQDYVDFHIGR